MPKDGRPRGLFVGLATLDVINRVASLPGANEKVTALHQSVAAGGPATNAAVTFAALGGDAVLLTALGTSVIARSITAELESVGVAVVDIAPMLDAVPSVSSVMVTDATGDRAVVGGDAAGMHLSPPPEETLSPLIASADVVLIDGHHPSLAAAVARLARLAGTPVVIDAGRWKPVMGELISSTTEVVASADFRLPGARTADDTARELAESGVPTVVTTAGPQPVRWRAGSESGEVPTPSVRAVDTVGAGDVFHGAYAFALASGVTLVDRIRFASGAASTRCAHAGPRSWLSALAAIEIPRPSRRTF